MHHIDSVVCVAAPIGKKTVYLFQLLWVFVVGRYLMMPGAVTLIAQLFCGLARYKGIPQDPSHQPRFTISWSLILVVESEKHITFK